MKILLISNRVPFPPNGGYAIVVYNTIKELVEIKCDLTLFSLNTTKHFVFMQDVEDELVDKINFLKFTVDNKVKVKDAFFNLFNKKSYNVSRFYTEDCSNVLAKHLKENRYDIIQLEGLEVTPYLQTIRNNSNAKVIYRSHNVEHQIWNRLANKETFILKRFYLQFLSQRLKKYECNVLNDFDYLMSISAVDEHFFKSIGCKTASQTFPVALNLNNYQKSYQLTSHPSIGYIGSMDWRPNIEGLNWFLDNVWPQIQLIDNGIKFHLAGKNIPSFYYSLKSDDYIIEGEVSDALQFIAKHHVLVVPLFSGSGMRVKIIEAMALGKCVIATSIAAEGINYQHDKNILIADKADDFYKQILRCFTDKSLIKRIGLSAKKLTEEYHDNKKISKKMLNLYTSLCDNKTE